MSNKNHYRKVLKSDHLGVPDLEDFNELGIDLKFTIDCVKQHFNHSVAGKKINCNVAYFVQDKKDATGKQVAIKPLVLNLTNCKVLKSLSQGKAFVEDWAGLKIELRIDPNVQMKGEVVGGIRINPTQWTEKQKPPFTQDRFMAAKQANATIDTIKQYYSVTAEIEKAYNEFKPQ